MAIVTPKSLRIEYDGLTDVLTIEGMKYRGDLFRQFGGLMPQGGMFRLVKREDGVITIERIASA